MRVVEELRLIKKIRHKLESNMGRASGIAGAVKILNANIDHPEIDTVIRYLTGMYSDNEEISQMCVELEYSIRKRREAKR